MYIQHSFIDSAFYMILIYVSLAPLQVALGFS